MKVHIELVATLRRPAGWDREFDTEISPGTTVHQLLEQHFNPHEMKILQVLVKGERVSLNYEIKENDSLFITVPIGGG